MPTMTLSPGVDLFYQVDDFTDPWGEAETVFLLHGNAESGEAWRAWIPHLGRRFRIVRPDMRGFGRSTPMAEEYPWSIDTLVDDFARLAKHLGVASFHLVAAKIGGTISLKFAAAHPELVKTLTVLGTPPAPQQTLATTVSQWVVQMRAHGVGAWARESMRARLGSTASAAMLEYWTRMMGGTNLSTQLGFMRMVPTLDLTPDLARIGCRTLIVTTTGSGLGTVAETEVWRKLIPQAELLVIDGDSYHVAASHADAVAPAVAAFMGKHGSPAASGAGRPS
ncbi:MAG: alpha/beta fold hydrolase [Burkholderiales bacterium]